ncbi:MAG: flagellar hook capping FlgD N-terminal domain-containing protein [Oscillospiraceae bacterium]
MGVNNINSYNRAINSSFVDTDSNGNRIVKSDSSLGMDDFLNLLASQMSSQDPMNPTDNNEYMSQMAQFSSLQAMKTLTELSTAQYGASLVGKYAIVAHVDERGQYKEEKGLISKASFLNGVVSLTVNGSEYEMSSVMEVITKEEFEKPEEEDKEDTEDTTKPDGGKEEDTKSI